MDKSLKEVIKKIKKAKSVAIFSHVRPDGDSIGSMCAFYLCCKAAGKKVSMYLADEIRPAYGFIPETKYIKCGPVRGSYDLFVCLDTSAIERLGDFGGDFKTHSNSVRIDHHVSKFGIELTSYVDPNASSTCEILFDIFKGLRVKLSPNAATCLITGLLTDTGHLMHQNATEKSFRVCAELVKLGAVRETVSYRLFKEVPMNVLKFKARLIECIEILDQKFAFAILTLKNFKEFNVKNSDIEDFVNILVGVNSVNYAILVSEIMPGHFKISLRGKVGYPVRDFAESIGGGGHLYSSGANMRGTAKEIKEKLIAAARERLK